MPKTKLTLTDLNAKVNEYLKSKITSGFDESTYGILKTLSKEIADEFGLILSADALSQRIKRIRVRHGAGIKSSHVHRPTGKPEVIESESTERTIQDGLMTISSTEKRLKTIEDVVKAFNIDMSIWRVKSFKHGHWDTTVKLHDPITKKDIPQKIQNVRMVIQFERIVSESTEACVNGLIKRLEAKSPVVPRITFPKTKSEAKHAVEFCLMDPHYGLRCVMPEATANWDPELCEKMVMASLELLIERVKGYGPFEQVFLPFGNDFFHVDNVQHTTTRGTAQPEAESHLSTFVSGETVAMAIIDRLKQLAPVHVYFIPGNHDHQSSLMLGRVVNAYYRNDKNVIVDASLSPYKFHRYGCNLIGYDHGYSVNPLALSTLMANERPIDWAETASGFREWHLGDQHRIGRSRPIVMEEQGVSVDFLPALTAPNAWHKNKGYNWQKRGAVAFVWHHKEGQVLRAQVNVDRYKNWLLGRTNKD